MLRSVRGEPAPASAGADATGAGAAAAAVRRPAPAHPPEAVVAAQLAALQEERFADVFAHASPSNRAATGPLPRFARMLHAPAYAPLLGHGGAETLQRLQPSVDVFMELVRVTPAAGGAGGSAATGGGSGGGGGGVTFLWVLSRQPADADADGVAHCWMVDSVQPVGAMGLPPAPPGGA